VFSAVSTITGHSVEDLDQGMFLESDLGMDSIKIVEFMNSILDVIPVERREAFYTEVPMRSLMQMQTVGEVIRVLGEWVGPRPETPGAETVESTVTGPNPPSKIESPATADTVEILHSQYPFLVSHWAVSTCSLCSRVRLQGPFDTAAAQRTWQGLLDRHPALRARFSYPPEARSFKDYRMEVLKTASAPDIDVHDLRSLPPADQAAAIAIEMRRCVNHEWALDQWPLHRFFSWRLADDVHELFLTNHHLVADGLSNQQIVREFVELYRAAVTG